MRIALAHDWLTNWAGSERVVDHMVGVAAPGEIIASIVNEQLTRSRFPGTPVSALWPSGLPGAQTHWPLYALPMIAAWATAKIEAEALLVSSHFAAHGAVRRFDGPSIVYYHTPARLIWRPEMELGRLPLGARRFAETVVLPVLRRWDRQIAQMPSVLLANSRSVARRIEDAYGRDAAVLHPPVDIHRWRSVPRKEPRHLVWLGRLVAYKRPDVAVEVARSSGLPLVVVGDGPERARLECAAPPNVRFLGYRPEAEVRDVLAHASALVFPGEEDFGIAPVECLAAGVPVVAHAAGGALDYVRHGVNGLLVGTQDPQDFVAALREAAAMDWNVAAIRDSALPFASERFRAGLRGVLDATFGLSWSTVATGGAQ